MRLTHVISNLGLGGAENAMCSLIEATQGKGVDNTVIVFVSGGALRRRLEAAGATVIELGGRRGTAGARVFVPMAQALRRSRPDLVQAWMYHANAASILARMLGFVRCPLIWNVRQSLERPDLERPLTRLLIAAAAPLSRFADTIVYNSHQGAETHEAVGFGSRRRCIIVNGVDCVRFRPRKAAKVHLRQELGLPPETVIVGRVARYAAMKDFATLFMAFREILLELPEAQLVLVGNSCEESNAELVELCHRHGCAPNVRMLGPRLDVEQIYPALDVLVSSSIANEGFPNVIGEAMACGTLVVSTAVGETTLVRDGCHIVVEPANGSALAQGVMRHLLATPEDREELGRQGRAFIEDNFSLQNYAAHYERLYRLLARPSPDAVAPSEIF